jgi:hypothetical protein
LFAVKVVFIGKVNLKLVELLQQALFHSEPILWCGWDRCDSSGDVTIS